MDIVEELNAGEPATGEVAPAAEPTQAEPQAEPTQASETPEQKADRERDEKGRFKAKQEDQTMVPLTALHETRDKLRTLEAELEKLRTPPQEAPKTPDIFEDPEGFTGHINNTVQQAVLNTTLNISEVMTRKSAGDETVNEAQQWGTQAFAHNPALYQQFLSQPDPYGFLVEQYQRATAFSKLGDDPSQIEEFLKWREAQSAPQPAPTPAIPTSLASEQSSRGGAVPYQPPSLEEILRGKP